MAAIDAHRRDPAEQRGVSNAWAWAGGVAVTLAVLIIGGGSGYVNARRLNADRRLVAHTHEVIGALETLLSTLKDAETGQRGYLLTQDQEYLAPYESALQEVSSELARLQTLTADNPPQRSRLDALAGKIHRRLEELTRTVTLTRNGERVAALAIVRGASGKAMMDEVRRDVAVMERVERDLLQTRDRAAAAAYRTTVAWILIPVFIGVVLIWVLAWLSQRNAKQQLAAALALAEEKERLRTTLRSIGDAVIATDSQGNINYLNPVAETLTGWTDAEARGVPLPQVFHIVNETTRLPVENPALRALSEGVIVGLANHTVLIARSGGERPIDDSAAPIRGPGDELIGCVLVFRDISGRRLAEQQVHHREEQFRRTLDEIAIPTLLHADDDEVLLVNRAWSQITGYGHADIPTIGEWTRRAYGERHASVKRYIDELFESEARVDNGEWEITTASGEKRMWHFYATPVGREPGGRRLVVSNAIDVTEQRQAEAALRSSEERLRMAQHASKIGTFEWNIQTGVNTWTPELESMYGLQPGGFAGTQSGWEELVHPEDRTRVLRSVGEALANGHFADEWRVVWADGSTHWLTGRGRVFKDAAGNPSRMLGIHIDITERKEGEEKLRQLAAELSEADRRKDEFLATLAHELRNPLAPIRNGLQILQRSGGHHPDYEQVRAVMERQTDQLVRLVDDLMDVSRITRGKLELRKEPVELATVLHQAAETVRPIVESRGQELTITLLPTPAFVDADATRLGQVFANLLNNAAKYSERGRHIWLTIARNNGEFAVSVRDEGIGIPVHRLSEIFGMFTQIDGTLEQSQAGLGIGLTLAKHLVEMHEGTIEARSRGLGHGSEFVVRLPAVLSLIRESRTLTSDDETVGSRVPHRILIADDNEDSVNTMALLLNSLGHDTRTAHDGLQAVTIAADFEPDVVFLDIGMPRLNGYDACRRIREQAAGGKALMVALSGWGQDDAKRRSQEAGFHYHLVKPIDPRMLGQLLSQFVADRPPVLDPVRGPGS